MKNISENNSVGKFEEITSLDVKDYEDLGLIIELEELGGSSYENSSIDFNVPYKVYNTSIFKITYP